MSEYDELVKHGYTEEAINLPLDDISKMTIFDSPMGPGREDKGVIVRDHDGVEKRTSSIMMGYNSRGIRLENGDYVSLEELERALGETLVTDEENVVYACKRSGKIVQIDDISKELFKKAMQETYLTHTQTDKVINQQAAEVVVHDDGKEYPKGIAMLGNNEIQLPSGEYVSEEEIRKAIQDYVMLRGPKTGPITPIIHTPSPEPKIEKEEPTKKEEVYTVIKRIVHKASVIPVVVATTALILSGFGRTDTTDFVETRSRVQNVGMEATRIEQQVEFESHDDVLERLLGDFTVGEQTKIEAGVPYYASSDYEYGGNAQSGVFGEGIRQAGNYNVEGFSILKDGHIVQTEWQEGEDLYAVLEQVAKDNNTTIEALKPMLHIGGPVAGWVNVDDLISEEEKTPQEIAQHVVLDDSHKIEGHIDNFEGDSITVQSENEDVTLKIKKDDGSFVQEGDIIIGSDGQEYQIQTLSVEDEEVIDYEEVKIGTRLEWSIKNITLAEALAAATVGVVGTYISSKIDRKEKIKMTDSEIDGMIRETEKKFKETKDEFKGSSEFAKATETLTHKHIDPSLSPNQALRDSLIDQKITVEEVVNMNESTQGGKSR